ncbi:MAG TPA: 2'-5' RNA ligase family protein [Nevskiaceae bacterium]|nr:2'-5' RNA ligase family protein [Nevskiaceae bacterium]
MNHRYLFALEVAPIEAGKTYDELPSHLTLMSRFFCGLRPEQLAEVVCPLLERTKLLELLFEQTTALGPKQLTVHMVAYSNELKHMHNALRNLLDLAKVDYEYPQFIGKGYKPHVTKRDDVQFARGDRKIVKAVCLVEVVAGKRVIRSKFNLGGGTSSHEPLLVFISGSINSGKTTTAKLLTERLDADFINVDDLNDTIPHFNLATDLDTSMDRAIEAINKSLVKGNNVVANYVIRPRDYDRFKDEINTNEQYIITLVPRLDVAKSKRGDRELSEWEIGRVQYHYDTGIAAPEFGHIIDSSDITLEETVEKIMEIVGR